MIMMGSLYRNHYVEIKSNMMLTMQLFRYILTVLYSEAGLESNKLLISHDAVGCFSIVVISVAPARA